MSYLQFTPLLLLLIACNTKSEKSKEKNIPEEDYYSKAVTMINNKNYDSAFIYLEKGFKNNSIQPMQILLDKQFYILTDDYALRNKYRSLAKLYTSESNFKMVRENEPGNRITVTGIIVDERSSNPIPNAIVELVHADNNGIYFYEDGNFNPRIFSILKTDENGEFEIQTIKPGRYKDDLENLVSAHIHFTIEASNYRSYGSEFTFEDDSVFIANGNIDNVPVAFLQGQSKDKYLVKIRLQKK